MIKFIKSLTAMPSVIAQQSITINDLRTEVDRLRADNKRISDMCLSNHLRKNERLDKIENSIDHIEHVNEARAVEIGRTNKTIDAIGSMVSELRDDVYNINDSLKDLDMPEVDYETLKDMVLECDGEFIDSLLEGINLYELSSYIDLDDLSREIDTSELDVDLESLSYYIDAEELAEKLADRIASALNVSRF